MPSAMQSEAGDTSCDFSVVCFIVVWWGADVSSLCEEAVRLIDCNVTYGINVSVHAWSYFNKDHGRRQS